MEPNDATKKRLTKLFYAVIEGNGFLNPRNAAFFLQAICIQPDPVVCTNKIVASKFGLGALQEVVRMRQTADVFNEEITPLLIFLQARELKNINGGEFLNDILLKLVDPPIFWDAFRATFLRQDLNDKAQMCLGWLLYQLCCLPNDVAESYRTHPDTGTILKYLLSSATQETRSIGQKLKKVLDTFQFVPVFDTKTGAEAGGRHDNDHEDFRKIAILPTADELASMEPAFLRPADMLEDPASAPMRVAVHLDNQFRLLREDMIYEMREELHVALGKKQGGFHRGLKIAGLTVLGIECGPDNKRTKWGLVLQCPGDLPQLKRFGRDMKARKDHLENTRSFLKHQSLACILSGTEIIAFPTIYRDEDRLAKFPPEIVLQFEGPKETAGQALLRFKMDREKVTLIQIDTAIFAYEPILKRLQDTTTLALSSELLLWTQGSPVSLVSDCADPVIWALQHNPNVNLQGLLETNSPIKLDSSQCKSLLSGLTQKLSLLQGPPGTGKSFIGALLAKAIYLYTDQTILVVCYTNHALDDILSGLLNIGIPEKDMLRLGGKSTAATEPLKLQNQNFQGAKRTREQWTIIEKWKAEAESLLQKMRNAFRKYNAAKASVHYNEFLDYLKFDSPAYFKAFSVPDSDDGMIRVGRNGQQIRDWYLISQWHYNQDAGIFKEWSMQDPDVADIWKMPRDKRQELWRQWEHAIVQDLVEGFCTDAQEYNRIQHKLMRAQSANNVSLFESKRIVGCTTTAAAKYCEDIQAFSPKVLLVEEAGEILESHILTALGPETSQVILIGDHKQLRPKVNNYVLSIEKGEGYDLNRSLFERLILKHYPHETLHQQHRMRPNISSLIRKLTYPELVDAPSTLNRPNILGLQDNIVFIDHNHQEDDVKNLSEKRDLDATSSKQNSFETEMILKIVKYLGQQGYGTDDLVILTPYLGQLQNLRTTLKKDNDTILSDLDSYELVRAGLINSAEAKLTKKAIRLATIDNYQGEECDIVVVSLTRSNPQGDIGFMFSPERLNVLLSRSRNGLIMIGNMDTFRNARNRKGKELWTRLFDDLRYEKHIYEGLPIKCEQHPDRTDVLSQPEQFDDACPDGGCNEPCGVILSCGVHLCPSKCHQLSDHSKMPCKKETSSICPNGHNLSSICSDGPRKNCPRCDRDVKLAKKRQEQEAEAKKKRDAEQQAHLERMDILDARLAEIQRTREDGRLALERATAIQQKEDDLAAAQSRAQSTVSVSTPGSHAPMVQFPDPFVLPLDVGSSPPTNLDGRDLPENAIPANNALLPPESGGAPAIPLSTTSASAKPHVPKPFPTNLDSPSRLEWARQKDVNGASNPHVDAIMDMTGLEEVKKRLLQTIAKVDASKRQNASLAKERFNIVFLGNPGTGKTTIARHYAKFLASTGVTPGSHFVETVGSSLANEGVDGAKKIVDDTTKAGGGTIFIDEAYQLTSGHSHGGAAVLDFLLAEMENRVGTIVFILAGYKKEMEKFFEHNPGLMSRVPHQLKFEDYKDEELMAIFNDLINKTFQTKMKVEGGVQGLYGRIAIRRLARRRGHSGFGNARDVQTAFDRIRDRQADRLNKLRAVGRRPDDFTFTAQDLIGPDPSKVIGESKAWNQLHGLIGLSAVKKTVRALFTRIQDNYQRELLEKEPLELSLNCVFLGSPGTGKTTVAKLYGQILVDLGMLSNGEGDEPVIIKNPSDFVGAALGASEANTKAILANTVGKVLIVDEAYMLYEGSNESGGQSNQFKTTVIDTMVAGIQSVPGEDRCVLLLGYTDEMRNMFQHVNPGLSRRFRIEDAFEFEDFDDAELRAILDLKLKEQDLEATEPAKKVALGLLNRGRNRPHFGNAGEVENIISKAKNNNLARRAAEPLSERPTDIVFSPEDFDPDHNRGANASANLVKLFEDVVGREDVVEKLQNFQELSRACRERGVDPREQIPTNFVFTGPPGTGKTTIARKIGRVFYDMNFLGSAEVIECSASDLVGQYVGQTGPKTKKLFEKALGKVLFIDEAYRLGEGHFAQEAIDEMVGLVTQPRFKSKLVIILAGYENDMNKLMAANAGLSSRFPDQITFENMDAESCISVLRKELDKKDIKVENIDDSTSTLYKEMKEIIRDMSELNNWGNARDMITLSKDVISLALRKHDASAAQLEISGADVLGVMRKLLADRQRRSKILVKPPRIVQLPEQMFTANSLAPPPISSTTDTHVSAEFPTSTSASPQTSRSVTPNSLSSRGQGRGRYTVRGRGSARATGRNPPNWSRPAPSNPPTVTSEERDPEVTDAIWRQLSAAKRAAAELVHKATNEIYQLKENAEREKVKEIQDKKAFEDLEMPEATEGDAQHRADLLHQREQACLKAHNARLARERAEAALREKKEAERKRKEQEEKAQRKLRELGVCPVGYRWINMGSVYRCAGGSHVVPVDSLGL